MRKLGNPFQRGTYGYFLLCLGVTLVMAFYYLTLSDKGNMTLFFVALGAGATARSWLKYSKLHYQQGQRFIED